MRKLASIQKIKALEPIPNADAIEKATVLGWQLVVKKGEFEVGDLCVYCEIDSVMPNRPEFEFLKPRKMRIRTLRLRGQNLREMRPKRREQRRPFAKCSQVVHQKLASSPQCERHRPKPFRPLLPDDPLPRLDQSYSAAPWRS